MYRLFFFIGMLLLASCGNQCGPGTYDSGNGCVYTTTSYTNPYYGGYGTPYSSGYPGYSYPGYYPH